MVETGERVFTPFGDHVTLERRRRQDLDREQRCIGQPRRPRG